ncbi:MAG TPA: hypothetical protein ENJ09_15840 [Planctomycetes bacterium]|nr:hypothetical protein [Planctomycetota bacterium]
MSSDTQANLSSSEDPTTTPPEGQETQEAPESSAPEAATDPGEEAAPPAPMDSFSSEDLLDDAQEEEEEEEVVIEGPVFDLATSETLSFTDLERGRSNVFDTPAHREHFRRMVEAMATDGDEGRRRGFGLWMLADYERCAEVLEPYAAEGSSPEAPTAAYARARALMALHRFEEASKIFEHLTTAHQNHPRPLAAWIESDLEARLAQPDADPEAIAAEFAERVKKAPGGFADTSDGRYLLGRLAELCREWDEALAHYAAGREAEPGHRSLLTRYARLAAQWGLDDLAIELYEELVEFGSADRSVLLNLGVLYEDCGRDADAAACYDLVLKNDGADRRAALYLADAVAGMDMYYDEDLEKKEDRLNQILRIPITDFELSVRARNCLNKMQITTLGDLVQRTEQELLSYKNFGETSLTEIKEILHSKGLRLGMPREEAVASIEAHASRVGSGDRSNVMNKPILELQLSIRARRTVETLGCLTVGDISKHSAEELLGMPNFGQTSLQELRNKLQELGVRLKGD